MVKLAKRNGTDLVADGDKVVYDKAKQKPAKPRIQVGKEGMKALKSSVSKDFRGKKGNRKV